MTAPLCPVHKRPGRYVFGSMVTCDVEDRELAAAKAPAVTAKTWTKATFNGIVCEGATVEIERPRAPQVGDRAFGYGTLLGTVVNVSDAYVAVSQPRSSTRTFGTTVTVYDVADLTFEPPVTP